MARKKRNELSKAETLRNFYFTENPEAKARLSAKQQKAVVNRKELVEKQNYNIQIGPGGDNDSMFDDDDISSDERTGISWRDGRRIVELGTLANAMQCSCGSRLHLINILKETVQGLGSILHVRCEHCGRIKTVPTGKRHTGKNDSLPKVFDINTKLAAAMLNAGIGLTQVNNILAEINLPLICHKTLKKREREIGRTIESVADESCSKAVSEEKEAMQACPSTSTSSATAEVSVDGGWQKRGTGRCRNSLSGHVTTVGKRTGKVVSFSVAKKCCRICSHYAAAKRKSRLHECRKNWNGSAKGMESYLTVKCISELKQKGLDVKTIIMDDDSTTLQRVKQCVSQDIQKHSDSNHVFKNFTSQLMSLKNTHSISQQTVSKFSVDFNYAVKQNEGNVSSMKSALTAIVPHAFGDHSLCSGQKWCHYDEKGFVKHKRLPYGRDLTGGPLREKLDNIISRYTTDQMLEKLSTLQSTNTNENMNNLIARKAPKIAHYSGSESLDYRVSAAVTQKNEGSSYLMQVNEKHNMSPGKFTEKRFTVMDKSRSKRRMTIHTVEKKRRRLELKYGRNEQIKCLEILEGPTYQPAIDVDCADVDIYSIPIPLTCPGAESSIPDDRENLHLVCFDLETTGCGYEDDIIQIAAKDITTSDTFSRYVKPTRKQISKKITNLTGIEMHGRQMYYNLESVQYNNIKDTLSAFQSWLQCLGPTILIAHNAPFDSRMLIDACMRTGIDLFDNVIGFIDTLKIFRRVYPGRVSDFKLMSLASDLLKLTFDAHTATGDVDALVSLCTLIVDELSGEALNNNTISTSQVKYNIMKSKNVMDNYNDFLPLINEKLITKADSKRIAGCGLKVNDIIRINQRSGADGVQQIFQHVGVKQHHKLASLLHTKFND